MSVGYAESSIFRFIICIVSFKRHPPPPSETFADYLQDDKQIQLFFMGFAKRRAGIFHNFVMMKRSTRFLPPDKRRDLQQLVALIRDSAAFTLQVRIPTWCQGAQIFINGKPCVQAVTPGEYAAIARDWQADDVVTLTLPMPVQRWQSHPSVHENAGRIALSRGPLLYCLESSDQPGGDIDTLSLTDDTPLEPVFEAQTLGGIVVLCGQAKQINAPESWGENLYQPLPAPSTPTVTSVPLRAIPYFTWQNRGVSKMAVWLAHEH